MSMFGKKKAQGLSMNVIVIAAIALIVLVVIVVMLAGKLGSFSKGTDDVLASGTQGFDLDDEDGVSVRSERFSQDDDSGIAIEGVAEDGGAAAAVESNDAETTKEVTTETAPTPSDAEPASQDNVQTTVCGPDGCVNDKGEHYLSIQYMDRTLKENENDFEPGSKWAYCDKQTDCVYGQDICIHQEYIIYGWICGNNNLLDLCDTNDKCDTVKIGEKFYYCDGVNTWRTTKPEGCPGSPSTPEVDDRSGSPGPGESCGKYRTGPPRCENEQTCPNGFSCDVDAGCLCLTS